MFRRLLLALSLAATSMVHAAPTSITLKDSVRVGGDTVRLDDIAVVEGPDAAAWRTLVVAASPRAGATSPVSRKQVSLALQRQGGIAGLPLAWAGAERTLVTRAAQRVEPARIEQVALDAARPILPPGARLSVARLAGLDVPQGTLTLTARSLAPAGPRVPVRVDLLVDGRAQASVVVAVEAVVRQQVMVARRDLAAGATLQASDWRGEERELAAGAAALPGASDLRLLLHVRAGEVLEPRHLAEPGQALKGDRVQLLARGNAITLSSTATVQRPGRQGGQIGVQPAGSTAVLTARLVAAGVAELE